MSINFVIHIFYIALAVSIIAIIATLVSLPKLGDERSVFIKLKAQSYSFTIIVGIVLLNIIELIYINLKTQGSYTGMNPIVLLTTISFVYLISLSLAKKKYGA